MNRGFPFQALHTIPTPEAEPDQLVINENHDPGCLMFHVAGKEIMRFASNGDIYVNGKLTENDKEVIRGLRQFLLGAGFAASPPWTQDDLDGPRPDRFERINDE